MSTWLWWSTRGTSDVELWLQWMGQVLTHGPNAGYAAIQADYPPAASLLLGAIGALANALGRDPRIVLKLTLLGYLLMTTSMVLAVSGRPGLSTFTQAALVLNAFGLMYLDILTAPLVIGAIWAGATGRLPWMTGLLAAACLVKWQPLIIVPFALLYVQKVGTASGPTNWRRFAVNALAVPVALGAIAIAVYGFSEMYAALDRAGHHNNLSNYGANPLWVLTWWFEWIAVPGKQGLSPDGLVSIMAASRLVLRILSVLSLMLYVVVLRAYGRSTDRSVAGFLRFAIAGYLVYFMFSAGVHENHLFLPSLLAIALAWQAPTLRVPAVALALCANINLLTFYGWNGVEPNRLIGHVDVSVIVAAVVSMTVAVVAVRLVNSPGQT